MTQDDDTNDVRMMNLFHESFQYTRKTHVNIENYLTLHWHNKDINNILQLDQQNNIDLGYGAVTTKIIMRHD